MSNVKLNLKGLEELRRKAEALDGKHNIPLSDLFPEGFLRKYTDFASLTDLEKKAQDSGFSIESQSDWNNLPKDQWDAFIAKHTRFATWQEMLAKGGAEWTARQLGLK